LPLYPELSEEMLDYVCSKIRAFFSEAGPE
jgi:dTDP-4-amino-4,6-dideoxygalactose transaminase